VEAIKILDKEIQLGTLINNAGSRHYYREGFGYNEDQLFEV
jgi:hypothetical protein